MHSRRRRYTNKKEVLNLNHMDNLNAPGLHFPVLMILLEFQVQRFSTTYSCLWMCTKINTQSYLKVLMEHAVVSEILFQVQTSWCLLKRSLSQEVHQNESSKSLLWLHNLGQNRVKIGGLASRRLVMPSTYLKCTYNIHLDTDDCLCGALWLISHTINVWKVIFQACLNF